ncbi:MAG: hypothetical protein V1799_11190 [bacterium]
MKLFVPVVSLSVWNELYDAAERFKARTPWEVLDDLDLIGVSDPATGETGYGVVLGSDGTFFGFCLYRGERGLHIYRQIIDDERGEDAFAYQDGLMAEFGGRADLETEDLRILKQLNRSYKGRAGWPILRSLLPGYLPWFLNESEARFLTLGLQTACHHLGRVERGEADESLREDNCLVYSPANDARTEFNANWALLPENTHNRISAILDLAQINSLKSKHLRNDTAWEADILYFPVPVMDRERPYLVRVPAICNQISGITYNATPATPDQSDQQVLADAICSVIERSTFKPDTLFVRDKYFAVALAPLAKAFDFTIRIRKKMESIQDLRAGMDQFLLRESKGGRRRK